MEGPRSTYLEQNVSLDVCENVPDLFAGEADVLALPTRPAMYVGSADIGKIN